MVITESSPSSMLTISHHHSSRNMRWYEYRPTRGPKWFESTWGRGQRRCLHHRGQDLRHQYRPGTLMHLPRFNGRGFSTRVHDGSWLAKWTKIETGTQIYTDPHFRDEIPKDLCKAEREGPTQYLLGEGQHVASNESNSGSAPTQVRGPGQISSHSSHSGCCHLSKVRNSSGAGFLPSVGACQSPELWSATSDSSAASSRRFSACRVFRFTGLVPKSKMKTNENN